MEEKYQFLNEGFPKHYIFNSNTAKSNQNITLITLDVNLIRISYF
jgi:hypothetical protein